MNSRAYWKRCARSEAHARMTTASRSWSIVVELVKRVFVVCAQSDVRGFGFKYRVEPCWPLSFAPNVAAGPQSPADLDAVEPGQHQVEDDRVVLDRRGQRERVRAGAGDVGRMALLAQAAAQQAGQLRLVLGDEEPHLACIVAPWMRNG